MRRIWRCCVLQRARAPSCTSTKGALCPVTHPVSQPEAPTRQLPNPKPALGTPPGSCLPLLEPSQGRDDVPKSPRLRLPPRERG